MLELRDFDASSVLVGSFNPLIFSPEWLQSANAIGPEEAAKARTDGIEVMAPNITSISFGSLKLVVEQGRLVLTVSDEPLIRAKDFLATCFRLLSHTPVVAMGLNFGAVMKTAELAAWHRFGDLLAPKEPWGSFLTDPKGERLGGLRGLVMERLGAPGDHKGYVRCTISVPENIEGQVSLQINNHFALNSAEKPGSGVDVYKIVEESWDRAMDESHKLIQQIKEMANAA